MSDELQAGLDYACDFMDEPSIQLIKYISADKSPINYAGYKDEKLDELYEQQKRGSSTRRSVPDHPRVRAALLAVAYQFPTIWWHRIIAHHDTVKNWHITPSHYLNQDLAEVWLAANVQSRVERKDHRPTRRGRRDHVPADPAGPVEASPARSCAGAGRIWLTYAPYAANASC